MTQEQKQPRKSSVDEEQIETPTTGDLADRKEALDDDIDAILEEIDEVLESNAEDFVRSFVQKGGQ